MIKIIDNYIADCKKKVDEDDDEEEEEKLIQCYDTDGDDDDDRIDAARKRLLLHMFILYMFRSSNGMEAMNFVRISFSFLLLLPLALFPVPLQWFNGLLLFLLLFLSEYLSVRLPFGYNLFTFYLLKEMSKQIRTIGLLDDWRFFLSLHLLRTVQC